MTNTWMNDPAIAHIDKSKLEFLQALVFESQSMNKEQMLPFLMAVAKRGQDRHITFSNEEIDTIIDTIKKYSTPEELDRINKMLKMRKR
jgi:hypothetical protein